MSIGIGQIFQKEHNILYRYEQSYRTIRRIHVSSFNKSINSVLYSQRFHLGKFKSRKVFFVFANNSKQCEQACHAKLCALCYF